MRNKTEKLVKDIRRRARRKYSAEEKNAIESLNPKGKLFAPARPPQTRRPTGGLRVSDFLWCAQRNYLMRREGLVPPFFSTAIFPGRIRFLCLTSRDGFPHFRLF